MWFFVHFSLRFLLFVDLGCGFGFDSPCLHCLDVFRGEFARLCRATFKPTFTSHEGSGQGERVLWIWGVHQFNVPSGLISANWIAYLPTHSGSVVPYPLWQASDPASFSIIL